MIEQIASDFSDNFCYCLYESANRDACLIDPIAVDAVRSFLNSHNLMPRWIINTHHHADHIGGNSSFARDDIEILVPEKEASQIQPHHKKISNGQKFQLAGTKIEIIETPGHTPGGISLLCDKNHLICGDILFLAGCGNPNFGGNPVTTFETFDNILSKLPDETVVYPGHDYSSKNLQFARKIDPENDSITQKLNEIRACHAQGACPTSTIGQEKTYNPFFRYSESAIKKNLDMESSSEKEIFLQLRKMRNQF